MKQRRRNGFQEWMERVKDISQTIDEEASVHQNFSDGNPSFICESIRATFSCRFAREIHCLLMRMAGICVSLYNCVFVLFSGYPSTFACTDCLCCFRFALRFSYFSPGRSHSVESRRCFISLTMPSKPLYLPTNSNGLKYHSELKICIAPSTDTVATHVTWLKYAYNALK